jgi:hypothetical protein
VVTHEVITIPTLVHLMKVGDPGFDQENHEVAQSKARLSTLFAGPASPHFDQSANFIWRKARVQFALEGTEVGHYRLSDLGLNERDIRKFGDQVPGRCKPHDEKDRELFRTVQRKFGNKEFSGLQVFVWARIRIGAGCTMSDPGENVDGAVWLEAFSLDTEEARERLTAHEIGHFFGLKHAPEGERPKRLMAQNWEGSALTQHEIDKAHALARSVMHLK